MAEVHRVLGFLVVATFAIGWLWPLVARVVKRDPGGRYWTWVSVAQVVTAAQAVVGIALLVVGRRVGGAEGLAAVLHYVYGLLPLLLFVVAHAIARAGNAAMLGFDERKEIAPWVPFAWAAFISFGLTLRALMTGLGIG